MSAHVSWQEPSPSFATEYCAWCPVSVANESDVAAFPFILWWLPFANSAREVHARCQEDSEQTPDRLNELLGCFSF